MTVISSKEWDDIFANPLDEEDEAAPYGGHSKLV